MNGLEKLEKHLLENYGQEVLERYRTLTINARGGPYPFTDRPEGQILLGSFVWGDDNHDFWLKIYKEL